MRIVNLTVSLTNSAVKTLEAILHGGFVLQVGQRGTIDLGVWALEAGCFPLVRRARQVGGGGDRPNGAEVLPRLGFFDLGCRSFPNTVGVCIFGHAQVIEH